MTQAKVPPVVARYFGEGVHPMIVSEFQPGKGWMRQSYKKRVSGAWASKLKKAGTTDVVVRANGRDADFRIFELIRAK